MLTLLLAIFSLLFSIILPDTPEYELTVEVLGVSSYEGQIQIAVFTANDDFPDVGSYQKSIALNQAQEIKIPFTLPAGEYAVAVYHDKNKNGKLDTNFMGIPKEDYGFSNNARGKMGPPSFEEARISLQESAQTARIEVH